jgi:diguanylate cyclase (GGDEF)-like protein
MRKLAPSLPPGQPDPNLVRRLRLVQLGCLAVVALISVTVISTALYPPFGDYFPMFAMRSQMTTPIALSALFCAISLLLSEPGHARWMVEVSPHVATLGALIAMGVLLENTFHISPGLDALLGVVQATPGAGNLPLNPAAAFAFLGAVLIFMHSAGHLLRHAVDVLVSCFCLLILIFVSENLLGALGLLGPSVPSLVSPEVLFCLVLLAIVVALRKAEHGVFSIFLGTGIGSRIARGFAPLLLVLPFLREAFSTRMLFPALIPALYGASILASLAAAFAILLLLFLVWRINSMEKEIHELTLRDDLTGLYNMRGFYLLAEQTLRLAQRAKMPFSVLFVDLDGLKQINDQQGHNIGSAYLAETGSLLFETFREGDVKGRFGGDEFVVAGQFSVVGIEIAAQRLQEAAKERNAATGLKPPLSFSIGYVTAEYYSVVTLKELVTKADEEMYKDKRRRKMARE